MSNVPAGDCRFSTYAVNGSIMYVNSQKIAVEYYFTVFLSKKNDLKYLHVLYQYILLLKTHYTKKACLP